MSVKTPRQVKDELALNGVSIAQWATENGLSVFLVYELLAGRKKGLRGEAHRAAVLLGLKEGKIVSPEDVKNILAA